MLYNININIFNFVYYLGNS